MLFTVISDHSFTVYMAWSHPASYLLCCQPCLHSGPWLISVLQTLKKLKNVNRVKEAGKQGLNYDNLDKDTVTLLFTGVPLLKITMKSLHI